MSPEAKKFFGVTREALVEGLGASENNIQELREEAQLALQRGDFDRAQELTGRLSHLSSLREDLLSAEDTITPILEKFGLEEQDLSFALTLAVSPTLKPEPQLTPERRIGKRKPEKYVEGAFQIIAQSLIARLPDGKFVFNSPREIAEQILQKDKKGDAEARQDASLYVYVTAKGLAEKLLDYAENAKAKRMKTLVYKALSRLRNRAWKPFYEEVGENYGNLSPQEFVDSVVLRLFPKREAKQEIQRERKRKERMRQKLIPSDLSPMDELLLCNKLMLPRTIERIRTEILDGESPESVARRNGWECSEPLPQAFIECREKMGDIREHRIPTESEAQHSAWVLQQVVRRLGENRKGWYTINEQYLGYRFLYSLMAEVDGATNVDKLLDILFQRQEYRVDSQDSFFLQIGLEGKGKNA